MCDSDASPPRRRRGDYSPAYDASPPRKRKRQQPGSDSSDASPPRRPRALPATAPPRAGLHSAAEIAAEARAAREAQASAADAARAQREAECAVAAAEANTARELAEARRRADALSAAPALGGTKNDGELNRRQRTRSRWDDPMNAASSSAGQRAGAVNATTRDAEEEKNYAGPAAPPNRFNITPGPRWDGIDRSNGFESRLVEAKVVAEAKQNARYRADMSGL